MKTDYSCTRERLEAKLDACNHDELDIKDLLSKGIDNLLKLDRIFDEDDIEHKKGNDQFDVF